MVGKGLNEVRELVSDSMHTHACTNGKVNICFLQWHVITQRTSVFKVPLKLYLPSHPQNWVSWNVPGCGKCNEAISSTYM